MEETRTPEEPRKIHGDKLAEALPEPPDEAGTLPRHPSAEQRSAGGWARGGDRADIQRS